MLRVLVEANHRGTVVLCAAADSGHHGREPYGIHIGTALQPPSQGWPQVQNFVDFCFPGDKEIIEAMAVPGLLSKNIELKSPNTLATAVASGVAALIIYCIRLLNPGTKVEVSVLKEIFQRTVRGRDRDSQFWILFEECQNLDSNEETVRAELQRLVDRFYAYFNYSL